MPSPCPSRHRGALRQPGVGECGDGAAVVGSPYFGATLSGDPPPPARPRGAAAASDGACPLASWSASGSALVSAVIVLVGRERAGSVLPRAGVSRTRPFDLANFDWRGCPVGGGCGAGRGAVHP